MSKRVFVAFAVEDKTFREFLAGQAKLDKSPFDFTDMGAQEPWDEKWKANCRARIKGCDGLIGLISKNTPKADGLLWEIQCAYDETIGSINGVAVQPTPTPATNRWTLTGGPAPCSGSTPWSRRRITDPVSVPQPRAPRNLNFSQ